MLPSESYARLRRAPELTLFLVLGSIYVLAVLVLESAIMPLYVYRPLRRMLEADAATQTGDREREMIPPEEILGDEIGQIMRSRNETVAACAARRMNWPPRSGASKSRTAWSAWACFRPAWRTN